MFLVSVEFIHEMSCVPRPPEILRTDSANSRQYNGSTLGSGGSGYIAASSEDPFPFLTGLSREEEEECDSFETHFKKFMYGGVPYNDSFPTWKRQAERLERNGGPYGSCFQKWDRYNYDSCRN
jgi:hypothetical protein